MDLVVLILLIAAVLSFTAATFVASRGFFVPFGLALFALAYLLQFVSGGVSV